METWVIVQIIYNANMSSNVSQVDRWMGDVTFREPLGMFPKG